MNRRHYILIAMVVVAAVLWFIWHKPPATKPPQQVSAANTLTVSNASPPTLALVNATVPGKRAIVNTSTGIAQQYQQGQVGKDQAVEATILEENQKSLDLYGKVVDQYGAPVADAKVCGGIGINVSMVQSGGEVRYTQTDAQGCFNFLGIHGAGIGIWPQKEGYFYNLKIPWQRPQDYYPEPNNPLIFTMWKIRGSEPLVQTSINADLPSDGGTIIFDSSTGKQSEAGDLKITFVRSPEKIRPGLVHPFDWQFKMEVVNGGLIQESDFYPYWSPASGYQPSFDANFSSNSIPWQNQLMQNFYIKSSSGKYGRMSLTVFGASTPPQAQVNITLNPSGSQNLEPDFSRQ